MSNVSNFPVKAPEPTIETPHLQIDWLCENFVRRYKNEATKNNIRATVRAYKTLLNNCNGYDDRLLEDPRFFLSIHCDKLSVYKAAMYWEQQKLSPFTRTSRIKTLKNIFKYAASLQLTQAETFIDIPKVKPKRSTLMRSAYNEDELKFIWNTFNPVIEYVRKINIGYQRTGLGVRPERGDISEDDCLNTNKKNISSHWWKEWNNLVWYFENVMDCKAYRRDFAKPKQYRKFFDAAKKFHGGLSQVYRKLGVTPIITVDLLAPLAMKLCWETGLNPESVLTLKRDCFALSHPLTGLPYIRYYKARSTGEKDLHLSLFDTKNQNEIQYPNNQSLVIQKTIQQIMKFTEPLLERADEKLKDYLFIYQANTPVVGREYWHVVHLNVKYFAKWSSSLMNRLKKDEEKTLPTFLNLGRFRPTKITEMAKQGKDFFEIQAIAGHSKVITTFNYLDSHQINPKARKEVSSIIKRIHENTNEFQDAPKPYSNTSSKEEGVIYKAIFCDCKNIYDPPASVRQLASYKKGQPCIYFNMCLNCPNIIITTKHLPILISYRNEIRIHLSKTMNNAPNAGHYEKVLEILNGIFFEYDEKTLEWAEAIAECADHYSDPLTYHPVNEN